MAVGFSGDSDWKVSGPWRWHRDGWDMDRLIIPVRGDIDQFDSTNNQLNLWGTFDGQMFLSDYPSDDHKQFPTISLTFIGKKGGVLPPPRNTADSSIQQTSGIVFSDAYILTFGLPPHWTAKITYTAPVSRYVVFSRTPPNFDEISAPVPPEIGPADIASLVIGGIDYSVWTVAAPQYDRIVSWVLRWFAQRSVKYTSYQELVPNQYYRATVTQQKLLLPIQEEIVSA